MGKKSWFKRNWSSFTLLLMFVVVFAAVWSLFNWILPFRMGSVVEFESVGQAQAATETVEATVQWGTAVIVGFCLVHSGYPELKRRIHRD